MSSTPEAAPVIDLFTSPIDLQVPEPPTPLVPGQPAPVVAHKIDFPAIGWPEYHRKFAIVIDNAFTPEDCAKLRGAAEASAEWAAKAHGGPTEADQLIDVSFRKSQRIMLDDFDLADWIFERIRPFIKDIEQAPSGRFYTLNREAVRDSPIVELSRLNERLRFLRYGPGQFFSPHCDRTYFTPDRSEISYYTLQLYLNGDAETLKGGSTRFFSRKDSGTRPYLDVPSRTGRIIIFQQFGLLHSGEEVVSGEKFAMRTDLMYKKGPPATTEK